MSAGYPREARITQRADFRRIIGTGKRLRTSDLNVHWIASPLSIPRAGVIVPLLGHNAVERNHLKRQLRSLVRTELLPLLVPVDVVIRCQASAYACAYALLREQIVMTGKQIVASQRTDKSA